MVVAERCNCKHGAFFLGSTINASGAPLKDQLFSSASSVGVWPRNSFKIFQDVPEHGSKYPQDERPTGPSFRERRLKPAFRLFLLLLRLNTRISIRPCTVLVVIYCRRVQTAQFNGRYRLLESVSNLRINPLLRPPKRRSSATDTSIAFPCTAYLQ